MKIFPKRRYVITSHKDVNEIRDILDNIRKNQKYLGRWDNGILYLIKNTADHVIEPDLKVSIKAEPDGSRIIIEAEMRERFVTGMLIVFGFLAVFEFLVVRSLILTWTFDILAIFPLALASGIYFIFNTSNKWSSESFKHLLTKLIKSA